MDLSLRTNALTFSQIFVQFDNTEFFIFFGLGVRCQPEQAQTHSGHSASESGQADRLLVQVPQRPSGRRAVQR